MDVSSTARVQVAMVSDGSRSDPYGELWPPELPARSLKSAMPAFRAQDLPDTAEPDDAVAGGAAAPLFDVRTTDGLASIAAVRDAFMHDPTVSLDGIRPRIARSWRRSVAMKVDPFAPVVIDPGARIDEQTRLCAEPFVREVERLAFDAGGDITVISPDGVLVHDLTPAIVDRYPHGRVLLESVCGTNGDGTALEEGQGGWVYSQEHFREDMMSTGCYTVLIRDPFRDNVRALVSLTLPESVISASDARGVALVMEGMAAKVVRELAKRSASREQLLFSEYLRFTRRYKTGAVLATDGKNFTLSDPALELLREVDFAAVSSYAQSALRSGRSAEHELTLSGNRPVQLLVTVPGDAHDPLGAIVVVKPRAPKRVVGMSSPRTSLPDVEHESPRDFLPKWVAENVAFRGALALAASAARDGKPAHIIGEKGTGKRTIARTVAQTWSDAVVELACARAHALDDTFVSSLLNTLATGQVVVLRDVETLPAPVAEQLAAGLSQLESPRVVFTMRSLNGPASMLIGAVHSVEVSIPALRLRREDIPILATLFAGEVTQKPTSPRLLYVLAQGDWPGNVAQLKSVVQQAAANARGIAVEASDLPQAFRGGSTRSSLSRLEEVELQEVRAALAEAGGNRSVAADILQIGRSTLYRRLDSYRRRGIVL